MSFEAIDQNNHMAVFGRFINLCFAGADKLIPGTQIVIIANKLKQ
jgi:hypothetical protein